MIVHLISPPDERTLPSWVPEVAKRIWHDVRPKDLAVPDVELLSPWLTGMLSGAFPEFTPQFLDKESPDFKRTFKVFCNGMTADEENEVLQLLGEVTDMKSVEMHLRADVEKNLRDSPSVRNAFAHGLLWGTRLLDDTDLFDFGSGNPRQFIYLTLWLNWPKFQEYKSIASVYRAIESGSRELGGANMVGEEDRFRKITQEIGFKLPAKNLSRKSNGV